MQKKGLKEVLFLNKKKKNKFVQIGTKREDLK